MKLVFMGTPEFAATILEDLIEQHDVIAVYTRPDAIRGRGKVEEASPVKLIARRHDIPVFTPASLRDVATQDALRALEPDVICVAAYGAILPREVLEVPRLACLNVHASLLPAWRGAAPIERAILADDIETGVCIMRMEEGLDTGDYCICRTAHIEDKTAAALSDELANLGSHALLTALIHLQEDAADWTSQDEAKVSYAEKIEKGELNISPVDTARLAVLKVRASTEAHPSRCVVGGRSVTVLSVRDISEDEHALELVQGLGAPFIRFVEKRLFFAANDGAFEVLTLKPDGKQAMEAKAFAAGLQGIKTGTLEWSSSHV